MKQSELFNLLMDLIDNFQKTIPIIEDLKNHALRERHWSQMKEQITNMEFLTPHHQDFNFELISRPELLANDSRIKDISKKAVKEKEIEDGLEDIRVKWQSIKLNFTEIQFKNENKIFKISKEQELENVFNQHTELLGKYKVSGFEK